MVAASIVRACHGRILTPTTGCARKAGNPRLKPYIIVKRAHAFGTNLGELAVAWVPRSTQVGQTRLGRDLTIVACRPIVADARVFTLFCLSDRPRGQERVNLMDRSGDGCGDFDVFVDATMDRNAMLCVGTVGGVRNPTDARDRKARRREGPRIHRVQVELWEAQLVVEELITDTPGIRT